MPCDRYNSMVMAQSIERQSSTSLANEEDIEKILEDDDAKKSRAHLTSSSSYDEHKIVATCSNGKPFHLYNHQVGGHRPLLRGASGEVCKPAISLEVSFYKSIDRNFPKLKPFVPEFLGCIDVDLPLLKRQNSIPKDLGEVDLRKRKRSATPRAAEFSYTLWRKLAQDPDNAKKGGVITEYMVLEDLTRNFKRPSVLDIKLGTRQHGEDAKPEKVIRHMAKCKATTSLTLGLRLCGMQVFLASAGEYLWKDKHWGRKLGPDDIESALSLYLSNGARIRQDVLPPLIARLNELIEVIKSINGLRYYSSSLLLLYEGEECECEPKIDVRIIDFAHVHYDQRLASPDEGYLLGLNHLVAYFNRILQKSHARAPAEYIDN